MGRAGCFHRGAEREHAENHVEDSPFDRPARLLDVEAAGKDNEEGGDQRQRSGRQDVECAEHDDAADRGDRERRFVSAKGALFRLGETQEVALLHEPMNCLGRPLHEKGVANSNCTSSKCSRRFSP